tara:strand:- start:42 stop:674 length:633 start_codon:yes stop_codon:yes gene_type:complete
MNFSLNKKDIKNKLIFKKISDISSIPEDPGIYFFRLQKNSSFNSFENEENERMIYIGKSEESLSKRLFDNHLSISRNFSTFRRSVGAVLKDQLGLNASPRISKKNGVINSYNKYSFAKLKKIGTNDKSFIIYDIDNYDDENKLNDWIYNNLEYSYFTFINPEDIETRIKNFFKPILNCNHDDNYNIYRDNIKYLRKICRDECKLNYKDKI